MTSKGMEEPPPPHPTPPKETIQKFCFEICKTMQTGFAETKGSVRSRNEPFSCGKMQRRLRMTSLEKF